MFGASVFVDGNDTKFIQGDQVGYTEMKEENKKVKVLLVSLDSQKDLEKKLIPFIERKKIDLEYLLWGMNGRIFLI